LSRSEKGELQKQKDKSKCGKAKRPEKKNTKKTQSRKGQETSEAGEETTPLQNKQTLKTILKI